MYRVEIDWAPAYELLISCRAYASKDERRTLDMGAAWFNAVREKVGPRFAADLASLGEPKNLPWPDILVRLCPGERDAAGFINWLQSLRPGDIYELLAPFSEASGAAMPRETVAARERSIALLGEWYEKYFRHLDTDILKGLAVDASDRRATLPVASPLDVVEAATSGVRYEPGPNVGVVLLVPQYHYRPWNLFSHYNDLRLISYAVDAMAPAPGDLPSGLLRLTHALSDESRLRILRHLASGPRSFTDVVDATGLAKSTVHHHMVALRSAGLVRVHDAAGAITYSLRDSAVDQLGQRLNAYLTGGR